MSFLNKYGSWAIVTGASSGIGTELARKLASKKMNLLLVARRLDRLQAIAAELEGLHGVQALAVAADLSRPDFLEVIKTSAHGKEIGLLINNAGYGISGDFLSNNLDSELQMLHTNSVAPVILTHHFGQQMLERKRGGIIFISSVVSFQGLPYMSGYAASKAHNLLLAEGLNYELKGSNIDVLAVCPGATESEFASVAGTKQFGQMTAGSVAQIALSALGKKPVVVCGASNKMMAFTTRFSPRQLNTSIAARIIQKLRKAAGGAGNA